GNYYIGCVFLAVTSAGSLAHAGHVNLTSWENGHVPTATALMALEYKGVVMGLDAPTSGPFSTQAWGSTTDGVNGGSVKTNSYNEVVVSVVTANFDLVAGPESTMRGSIADMGGDPGGFFVEDLLSGDAPLGGHFTPTWTAS